MNNYFNINLCVGYVKLSMAEHNETRSLNIQLPYRRTTVTQ